ncbi:MAG: AAA family ATPase [Chitinophagaceae bacterium]|nr:AAA family ATPase [Chitinophagaceae bacterium]
MNQKQKLFFTAKELLEREVKEIPTLWNPYLPKIGLVGLTGSSDTGKSTLLRQLAIAICAGHNTFLGHPLQPEHKNAIYISTEDSEDAIAACLSKQFGKSDPNKIPGLKFIFNQNAPIETACKLLEKEKADILIIDAWADLFHGNTNDVSQTRSSLNELNMIAQKYKCLVVILHHTVKNSEYNKPDKNKLNGSQGIEAKLRVLLELRPRGLNERVLSVLKGNYISNSVKSKSEILLFNEERLLFKDTGEILDKSSIGENVRDAFSTDKNLGNRIVKMKAEGFSFPEILQTIKEESPAKKHPSLSTIKSLYKSARQNAA